MTIKFANEIINEIKKRGTIILPNGSICGEEFEKWLCDEEMKLEEIENERGIKRNDD